MCTLLKNKHLLTVLPDFPPIWQYSQFALIIFIDTLKVKVLVHHACERLVGRNSKGVAYFALVASANSSTSCTNASTLSDSMPACRGRGSVCSVKTCNFARAASTNSRQALLSNKISWNGNKNIHAKSAPSCGGHVDVTWQSHDCHMTSYLHDDLLWCNDLGGHQWSIQLRHFHLQMGDLGL